MHEGQEKGGEEAGVREAVEEGEAANGFWLVGWGFIGLEFVFFGEEGVFFAGFFFVPCFVGVRVWLVVRLFVCVFRGGLLLDQ